MAEISIVPATRPSRLAAIFAFLAIYVIWGSTFLAIRVAVESIPPLFTAATRHLVAGSILLAWALWKGEEPTRQGWRAGLILGFLFFFVSHGLLHWAELSVPSGVTALVIAIEPAIVALLLPLLKLGPRPRRVTWLGLALGVVSVAMLFRPDVAAGESVSTGLVAVLVSATAWSFGIVYARKLQPASGSTMNAALPLFCGSVMLLVGSFLRGEHHLLHFSQVSRQSLGALLFLIFFGSLTAFSAYAWLLKHFEPTLVATHTYVNPMVAVLLGWAFAGERLTVSILISMALAILAIWLVNRGGERAPAASISGTRRFGARAEQADAGPRTTVGTDLDSLPFVDEHVRRMEQPPEVVWAALLDVLRRAMGGSARFARLLRCDPATATAGFRGECGDAVPGFRVAEADKGRRLVLRGRHRFARYALTFVLEENLLRAQTRATFPGIAGLFYRMAVIGSGGHRLVTRRLLRQVARAAARP